jgi:hypothetical protein
MPSTGGRALCGPSERRERFAQFLADADNPTALSDDGYKHRMFNLVKITWRVELE